MGSSSYSEKFISLLFWLEEKKNFSYWILVKSERYKYMISFSSFTV